MLDHASIGVRDLDRSRAFYDAAMAPLGYGRVMDIPQATGYGPADSPQLWIGQTDSARASTGFHIAFEAPDRAAVDAFYETALAAGGSDNGKPGLRPEYHPDYYGAFVIDPDGHHIEAVCHKRV